MVVVALNMSSGKLYGCYQASDSTLNTPKTTLEVAYIIIIIILHSPPQGQGVTRLHKSSSGPPITSGESHSNTVECLQSHQPLANCTLKDTGTNTLQSSIHCNNNI